MLTKKYFFQVFYGISLILLFCNCTKEKIVDTTFDKYVDRFFEEAQNRGVLINKNDFSFSITFGETPHLGVCSRPGNNITINEFEWNDSDEIRREVLIFHELGHCLLNRPHENVILPHGQCKSVMKGTEDNRTCFRYQPSDLWRSYYLDELFDIDTSLPDWYVSEITTTPIEEKLSFEAELDALTTRQVSLDANQNFEIVGTVTKNDGGVWTQIAWGEFEFIFRHNSVLISKNEEMLYFNGAWSTFFETDFRIVYTDSYVYYLLDGEMFHIDSRPEDTFEYIQVTTNAKDLNQKISINLTLQTIE